MKIERSIEVYCDNCGEALPIVAENLIVKNGTDENGATVDEYTTRTVLRVERCDCEDENIRQSVRKGKR